MTCRCRTKFIHEGQYAAAVEVKLIESQEGWAPYLSLEDAQKLDEVRAALRRGDLRRASQRLSGNKAFITEAFRSYAWQG